MSLKIGWNKEIWKGACNNMASEDYRKGGLQTHGQAERKSEEDL